MLLNSFSIKKYWGQHFLNDLNLAQKIVNVLDYENHCNVVLEIGPGKGILTKYLLAKNLNIFYAVDIDQELVNFLHQEYPEFQKNILCQNILQFDLFNFFSDHPLAIIGNFPYNISSQIFFKILQRPSQIREVVCTIQKEVAERITSLPNHKNYGILSVLLQTFYATKYLFTISNKVFYPQPKIQSATIHLKQHLHLPNIDLPRFIQLVKQAFQQRRKVLSNSLSSFTFSKSSPYLHQLLRKRAQELTVKDYLFLLESLSE